MNRTFLVRKDRIAEARVRDDVDVALADGQVRVALDRLALTANNVTYAAFGDRMDYWRFFPNGEDGWGVLPAWGFGSVVQSLHPGVAVGERLYGFWPLSAHAILSPGRLSAAGFQDAAPHRAGLHPLYNQYARCSAAPFYTAQREGAQAILRPLFTTSWLLDDFLAEQQAFGARRVLLSSASSKTAYATAWLLARRAHLEIAGLTSAANRAFCDSLGCYHRVLAYADIAELDSDTPAVYLDFAGDARLRRSIHERWGARLRHSSAIGGTHHTALGAADGLPGPRPTLFFAPAQAEKRRQQWGGAALQERIVQDWHAFLDHALSGPAPWLQVHEHTGPQAVQHTYAELVAGRGDPRAGHVVRLA